MPKLSLSRAWDETRAVLSRDGKLFASVALAIVVLPQTVIGLLAPDTPAENRELMFGLLLVTLIIGFIAQIALNRLAIGPSTTVGGAIARGLSRMPVLFAAFLLLMFVLFLIMIPLVLLLGGVGAMSSGASGASAPPAVILIIVLVSAFAYAIFQLAVPTAAAETGGPIRLLRRSWQLGRGNYLRLLAFVGMMFVGLIIVMVAGQVALGSIVTLVLGPPDQFSLSALLISLITALIQAMFTVVFAVMLARIYVQLANSDTQPSVPKTGT